jgi:putative transposase
MIRVRTFACALNRAEADALNRESGRHYTNTLVWHYRFYRRSGHWLSPYDAQRVEDALGGPTILHAHSRDAAQNGFYEAVKVAREQKKQGIEDVHYPHKRKRFRTTTWKKTGIRRDGDTLLLARAKGNPPLRVTLPEHLRPLPVSSFSQMELVYDLAHRNYAWHLTVDDAIVPDVPKEPQRIIGVDLGEIHPAAMTDGEEAAIVVCRELRSQQQYRAKRLSELRAKQDKLPCAKKKGPKSRQWWRLQKRINRFLAHMDNVIRDIDHKVSRAMADYAHGREADEVTFGDVRDIADGKRLRKEQQQKIALWSHGRQRRYAEEKLDAYGIGHSLTSEPGTTKTCPMPGCGRRNNPRGRRYRCSGCGYGGHRDVVGAANILSVRTTGTVGNRLPPTRVMYLHPVLRGKRQQRHELQAKNRTAARRSSRLDTAEMARLGSTEREAAWL